MAQNDGVDTADHARSERVQELLRELAGPTFRWRMAYGMRDLRGVRGTGTTSLHVELARRKSARTRQADAERDIEVLIVEWYTKHYLGDDA